MRQTVQIENERVRLTLTIEGGHVASILHKSSGVSPLWVPPWPSIEPSTYSLAAHPEYGADAESKLLSGIMGHNLCLDMFGAPSEDEARAGITVHGEASIVPYHVLAGGHQLTAACNMPIAQLAFERHIVLSGNRVQVTETVENLSALDRPIAWTQHVTLGPPFLERGVTQFRAPATRSRALGETTDFDWPMLPRKNGGREDLRVYTKAEVSGGFTTHLMDPHRDRGWFCAFSPKSNVLFGYVWSRTDYPWLGIWEENHSRTNPPWNGRTLTRGMEFSASPFPESRRQMIERNGMYGVPGYRWAPAKSKLRSDYWAFITEAKSIPETLEEIEVLVPA